MTEVQERFIREILGRVPSERLIELYLFPPLRRGGIETGVAVLALEVDGPASDPAARLTVLTATYRLQRRGPERGHFAIEVTEEAEAPLATVEAVVRGVQRRSGDLADAERVTPAAWLELAKT